MAELSDITADGRATRTIAIELEEPALVIAAVRDLGLADRPNTCMARGLKALVGLG
jgi:exopolyphosphatase/guanosine-5'-triphosphate,3'-diphosphate pyrophosphatase